MLPRQGPWNMIRQAFLGNMRWRTNAILHFHRSLNQQADPELVRWVGGSMVKRACEFGRSLRYCVLVLSRLGDGNGQEHI